MTRFSMVLFPVTLIALLGAGPVRDVNTLTAGDRVSLPDSTKIKIGRITTTLGRLRANHNALVASRQRVRMFNVSSLRASGIDHTIVRTFGGEVQPSHSVHVTPIGTVSTSGVPAASTSGFAADYRQFCNSVSASVCLYYPAGVTWWGRDQNGNYQTVDALITDPGVCAQEGGTIGQVNDAYNGTASGCVYTYPSAQTVNFLPPAAGFTATGWCNPTPGHFNSQIDQHGAVNVSDAGASGFQQADAWGAGTISGGTALEQFCFLQVKLK
jgi:hypothetical protein